MIIQTITIVQTPANIIIRKAIIIIRAIINIHSSYLRNITRDTIRRQKRTRKKRRQNTITGKNIIQRGNTITRRNTIKSRDRDHIHKIQVSTPIKMFRANTIIIIRAITINQETTAIIISRNITIYQVKTEKIIEEMEITCY